MKANSLIFIAALLVPSISYADYAWQGIKVTCTNNKAEIKSYLLRNEDPASMVVNNSKNETIYYGNDEYKFTCKLTDNIVTGTIKNSKGSAKGMCGAMPGSYVTVAVNEDTVIQRQRFTNECYESLESISFTESKWVGFIFKLCGNTGISSNPRINGCYEFKQGLFEKMNFPLPNSPIRSLYTNKWLKTDKN